MYPFVVRCDTWACLGNGRSLVSRVCAVDGALILSTTQATLVEQINSFLGLEVDQFEAWRAP